MAIEDDQKIKRNGFGLNSSGKIVHREMNYVDPDHDDLYAHGRPIGVDVAEKMIGDYWSEIKDKPGYAEKHVAFTIGKESLLSILSQKECAAVRFYLAKWDPNLCDAPLPVSLNRAGETIVAVGVKSVIIKVDNEEDKTEIWDIGAKKDRKLIVSPIDKNWNKNNISLSDADNGEIREMVPPYTIEDLRGAGFVGTDDVLSKAVSSFFSEE
jgi:hypothetical protein